MKIDNIEIGLVLEREKTVYIDFLIPLQVPLVVVLKGEDVAKDILRTDWKNSVFDKSLQALTSHDIGKDWVQYSFHQNEKDLKMNKTENWLIRNCGLADKL